MGCIQNTTKGFVAKDHFEVEKVDDIVNAGVEAKERTFVNEKNQRHLLTNLLRWEQNPFDEYKFVVYTNYQTKLA